jgi:hypothetical protein
MKTTHGTTLVVAQVVGRDDNNSLLYTTLMHGIVTKNTGIDY